MALCTECSEYPEGTACAMFGCPGRSFKRTGLGRSQGAGQASASPRLFDWLLTVPGIPAGWGSSAADRAGVRSFHDERISR